ncbi:MAG: hypothetical protein U0235_01105 [Polyangiaceae bacterium]
MSCLSALFGSGIGSCDETTGSTPVASADASDRADRPTPASDAGTEADAVEPTSGEWIHLLGAPDDCRIDVPADASATPPPIEWEPCGSEVPTVPGCRQMARSWPASDLAGYPKINPLAWGGRSSTGDALLMFGRITGRYIYRLIAEPDGHVLSAFREDAVARDPGCILYPYNTSSNRFAYALLERFADGGSRGYAAVIGTIAPRDERVVLRELTADPGGPGYLASAAGLIRLYGKLTLRDWNDVDASTFLGPTDEGAPGMIFPQGDDIFWASGTLAIEKHKVWTRDAGSRDFLGFGSDTTQGAADLGTDGKDMVWLEGSERSDPTSPFFPKVAVRAAPYTSDPAKLTPRTLRTDMGPYGFGGTPFVVGCGYAARLASPPALLDGSAPTNRHRHASHSVVRWLPNAPGGHHQWELHDTAPHDL